MKKKPSIASRIASKVFTLDYFIYYLIPVALTIYAAHSIATYQLAIEANKENYELRKSFQEKIGYLQAFSHEIALNSKVADTLIKANEAKSAPIETNVSHSNIFSTVLVYSSYSNLNQYFSDLDLNTRINLSTITRNLCDLNDAMNALVRTPPQDGIDPKSINRNKRVILFQRAQAGQEYLKIAAQVQDQITKSIEFEQNRVDSVK